MFKNWLIKRLGGLTDLEHKVAMASKEMEHVGELTRILNIMTELRAKALMLEIEMQRAKS